MTSIAPVRKELVVRASQDHAFRVFTEGIDRWWPRQHHVGKSPMRRTAIEAFAGGAWYSISEDDSICRIGKVLAWDPPGRLVLAWQITAHWQYDEAFVTEVEVTFTAIGPKETRVVLEHRDLDRFGPAAADTRTMIDAPGGWTLIFQSFAAEAAKPNA